MRTASIATAAALLMALTLTACGGSDDGDGGGSGGGDSGKGANDSAAAGSACTTDQGTHTEVGAHTAAPAVGDEGALQIVVTNKGTNACTLEGAPTDVELLGPTDYDVKPQQGASEAAKLTLAPDQSVTFTVSYARGDASDAQKGAGFTTLKFFLPEDDKASTHKWPDADVAITSEGELKASVGPFLPTGD